MKEVILKRNKLAFQKHFQGTLLQKIICQKHISSRFVLSLGHLLVYISSLEGTGKIRNWKYACVCACTWYAQTSLSCCTWNTYENMKHLSIWWRQWLLTYSKNSSAHMDLLPIKSPAMLMILSGYIHHTAHILSSWHYRALTHLFTKINPYNH